MPCGPGPLNVLQPAFAAVPSLPAKRPAPACQLYVNPDTGSGIAISLQLVFGAIAGGMFVRLGPTVGAMFLLALSETLRVLIGNECHGVEMTVYGVLLILFIIFMPKGILGTLLQHRS